MLKPPQLSSRAALLLLILFVVSATTALAQSPITVAQVLARVNQERVSRGMPPYALNAQLTSAAQTQANDMSRSGKFGHIGSDGSTVFDRTARAGYGAYSWGRRVGENYAAYHDLSEAMSFWMNSRSHRENILHTVYREMGVGIAPVAEWGGTIYVLTFGSEPNVLPVFINDGASQTGSQNVTLTLSDEDVYDSGNSISRVTQVQVSNDANFSGAVWQPFSMRIPWVLAPGVGPRTVYVKYRDSRGRTVVSSDTIVIASVALGAPNNAQMGLIPTSTLAPSPKPSETLTRRPTATVTRTLRPTATRTPTPEPSPTERQAPTATATVLAEGTLPAPATELSAAGVALLVHDNVETPARPVDNVMAPLVPPSSIDPLSASAAMGALVMGIIAIIKFLAAHPPT